MSHRLRIEFIGSPEATTEWGCDHIPREGELVEINGVGAPVKSVLWQFRDGEIPMTVVRLAGPLVGVEKP